MKEDCYGCFVDKNMLMTFLYTFGVFPWSYVEIDPYELLRSMNSMEDKDEDVDL